MKKGEIWSIDLPQSDGHEQEGIRPAVIIAQVEGELVIVIPITSNSRSLRYPHTLLIEKTSDNGLSYDSILLVFQIRAVDKNRLIKKLGDLETDTLKKVDEMLLKMLKINK